MHASIASSPSRESAPARPRTRSLRLDTAPPAHSGRLWMWLSAAAVVAYAVAVLVAASISPDLGFFNYQGEEVLGVDPGSGAAAAGLRGGDMIRAVDGIAVDDAYGLAVMLDSVQSGDRLDLTVDRAGVLHSVSFVARRSLPLASAAGIALALVLLAIAWMADRGGRDDVPRDFFRSTLVYVVFLAGTFSLGPALRLSLLAVPWIFAMCLAAPVTCRHMLKFPEGRTSLSRRELGLLYGPPLLLALVLTGKHLAFVWGGASPAHDVIARWGGVVAGAMAAAYLTVGAVIRAGRLRRKRDEIDPVAARWLHIGGVVIAAPLVLAVIYAIHDKSAFVSGGFRPFIAVPMVGGSACLVLAMTRTPFGELDRVWRRSSGYVLATSLAAALYLGLIGLLGGAAASLSGGDFQAAAAATLVAAVVFGPLRLYLQRLVDTRFARDRSRARNLLSEAANAAAATLDVDALQSGVVHRVRRALGASGAGLWLDGDGGFEQVVLAGGLPLPARVDADDPIAGRFGRSLSARAPRDLADDILVLPVPAGAGAPAVLVVAREDGLRFDEEERELLSTVAAQLVVALGNARSHSRLQEMTEKLRAEVERSEQRRREISRLKERVEAENRELIGQLASRSGRAPVIGQGLAPTFELVHRVAHSDASVLVRGETGVGKELVARAIHAASGRRDGPFIVVDCGAIAKGVFESALFGHERGAFTGAVRAAQGAFRAAHGGTIFLDELGELPLDLQPKLLRVLQEREVHPVGADKPVEVDVRVLAGTNRNLNDEVALGNFRQDLLYRLQVIEIEIPPLRRRRGDIPALAEHFLGLHAERAGRPPKRLSADAMTALVEHDWPGNVRELENALEAGVLYADGDEIQAADLPVIDQVFRKKVRRAISETGISSGAPRGGLRETLEELERDRLLEALRQHGGNKTRTAKALGLSRGALLRRIKRYSIEDEAAAACN